MKRIAVSAFLALCLFSLGCIQPPAVKNETGVPCGGWDTFGDTVCECNGTLSEIQCPHDAVCDAGYNVCFGTCGKCTCYEGPASAGRAIPCVGANGTDNATNASGASRVWMSRVYANGFCLGGCVRNLSIYANGTVEYYSRMGETIQENETGVISKTDVGRLAPLFYSSGFFALPESNNCDNAPTDAGGVAFYYKDDSHEKRVWVYGGCPMLPQLEEINRELQAIQDGLA